MVKAKKKENEKRAEDEWGVISRKRLCRLSDVEQVKVQRKPPSILPKKEGQKVRKYGDRQRGTECQSIVK